MIAVLGYVEEHGAGMDRTNVDSQERFGDAAKVGHVIPV
jgi:hypothetical protein